MRIIQIIPASRNAEAYYFSEDPLTHRRIKVDCDVVGYALVENNRGQRTIKPFVAFECEDYPGQVGILDEYGEILPDWQPECFGGNFV